MEGLVLSASVTPAFWAGKRVLVTGHTGFKGSWLVLWLQSLGAEVTGLALPPPTRPSLFEAAGIAQGMESHQADVRDADAVLDVLKACRPEIVFHLAAQPLVRESYADPSGTYAVNVMGLVHVLEAVRRTGTASVVVNVTTDKCYENREWPWGYREDEPLGGNDPYSSSKACSELVTSAYRRSFFAAEDAPRLASARAGNVIGGGDWAKDRLVPDALAALESGSVVLLRNPGSIRPWQHVLEPLSGYLVLAQALWSDASFAEAWNFGPWDVDARSVSWIVERLCQLWPEGERAWISDEGPHPHEAQYLKLDISKARSRLGWTPTWQLGHALEMIVDWHQSWREGTEASALCLDQIQAFTTQQQRTDHPNV